MRIERGGHYPGSPGDVNGFRARTEAEQQLQEQTPFGQWRVAARNLWFWLALATLAVSMLAAWLVL